MDTYMFPYSVMEQRGILCEAKCIVKSRDERIRYLTQLLKLVEDKEKLVRYDRQLREVKNERKRAAKTAITKENLEEIKFGKLEAELCRAE